MKSGQSSSFKSTGHRYEYQADKGQTYSRIHGAKKETPEMTSCYSARRHYESMQSKRTILGEATKPPRTPRAKTPIAKAPQESEVPLRNLNRASVRDGRAICSNMTTDDNFFKIGHRDLTFRGLQVHPGSRTPPPRHSRRLSKSGLDSLQSQISGLPGARNEVTPPKRGQDTHSLITRLAEVSTLSYRFHYSPRQDSKTERLTITTPEALGAAERPRPREESLSRIRKQLDMKHFYI
jgi:hypothetical protein